MGQKGNPDAQGNLGTNVKSVAVPGTPKHGQVTVGTAIVQLPANALLQGTNLKGDPLNTGTIYVGVAGVASGNGYPLKASESTYIGCDDTSKIFAIASSENQKLCFFGS